MKVKVGNKIYDGREQPVMVILTHKDKENIANMIKSATKYCQFPASVSIAEINKFMRTKEKPKRKNNVQGHHKEEY